MNNMKPMSWKHKFRTPRKKRRESKKLQSLMDKSKQIETNEPLNQKNRKIESSHSSRSPRSASSNENNRKGSFSTLSNSLASFPSERNKITNNRKGSRRKSSNASFVEVNTTVSYSIMRSVVAALSYVEGLDGFSDKTLYLTPVEDKKNVSTKLQTIDACCKFILCGNSNGKPIEPDHFKIISYDAKIIAGGLKLALLKCEPLIPFEMHDVIMTLSDSSEIENMLSSEVWPELTGMTFILLLQHLSQHINNISTDQQRSCAFVLAKEFEEIIFRTGIAAGEPNVDHEVLKEKRVRRTKTLESIILHMTKKGTTNTTIQDSNKLLDSPDEKKAGSCYSGKDLPTHDDRFSPNERICDETLMPSDKRENETYNATGHSNVVKAVRNDISTESVVQHDDEEGSLYRYVTNTRHDSNMSSLLNETTLERGTPFYLNRHESLVHRARSRLQDAANILSKLDKTLLESKIALL